MTWLPGFTRDESIQGAGGGTYTGTYPWRFVLHTTEGSWDSAMSVFRSRMVAPHLMYDPATRRKAQFIDLDRSAYALRHQGPETNRAHCIQVELIGFADRPFTGELADRIGIDLVAPVLAAKPITTAHPTFYGPGCGWTLASSSARQRMSSAAWTSFNGICGHQHVPGNEHWDPGAIDIDRIIRAAGQGEDDVTVEELKKELVNQDKRTAAVIAKFTDELHAQEKRHNEAAQKRDAALLGALSRIEAKLP